MWRNLFQNRRAAIKEGGDNLPMGLCFAAQSGNVLFLNRMMESLSYRLIGESLQNATYFWDRLADGKLQNGIVCEKRPELTKENQYLIRFANGECRTFTRSILKLDGEEIVVNQNMGSYQVEKEGYWQDYQNQQLTMISLVLGGIAAISLLVGGIGIMNIMLVTVTERTREIGIRRSLGAQRSSIVAQFLIESGMLCGMGGIVGIIFGTIGSLALGKILFQMTIFPATWVTLAAFGLSVALGVLFGSYPAAKASKLQPVEALRAD